jgi:hypothetical protein
MTDPSAVAGYRRALARRGVEVIFVRINGAAPHAAQVQATVMAIVTGYTPDSGQVGRTGFSETRLGAITQGDRKIVVLSDDLAGQFYPLPVAKNDKAIVNGETLTITAVDPNTRSLAGAIELTAAGV